MKLLLTNLLLLALSAASAAGQTPAADGEATATYVMGEIRSVDTAAGQLTVRAGGADFTVSLSPQTKYLRLAPGEESLSKAQPITLAEVGVGDRVLARGQVSQEQRLVPARQVIVMSKAALAEKQQRDAAEWRRRGIVGRVAAIDAAAKEFTLTTGTAAGEQRVTVAAKGTVVYRRYLPDTVRFTDAAPSSFEQLAVGDQVRALGDRSADGSRFTAEEIVSGSFRVVNGVVTAVDAAAGEVTINDIATRAPLVVRLTRYSLIRRLSPEVIAMIKGDAPAGADAKALVEQLPAIGVADLKVGDTIRVSSTAGADPSRLTAIAVAAGIEPLLAPSQGKRAVNVGGGSLGLSGGALDGIGLP